MKTLYDVDNLRTILFKRYFEYDSKKNLHYKEVGSYFYHDFDLFIEACHAFMDSYLHKFLRTEPKDQPKYFETGYIHRSFQNTMKDESAKMFKEIDLENFENYIGEEIIFDDQLCLDSESQLFLEITHKMFRQAGLTNAHLAIFMALKYEGLTQKEAAKEFKISERTVRNRLKYIISELAKVVEIVYQ